MAPNDQRSQLDRDKDEVNEWISGPGALYILAIAIAFFVALILYWVGV